MSGHERRPFNDESLNGSGRQSLQSNDNSGQNNDNQMNGNETGTDSNENIHPFIPAEEGNPNCPVCLNRITNRAYTNRCLHEFCRPCIEEWSREHNRCPVCRAIFTKIFFNIRSTTDYDETEVTAPPSEGNGFLLVFGSNGIINTPSTTGLYIINPINTPHGIHYRVLFLAPNQVFLLTNVSPNLMVVPPNQMPHFLYHLDHLGFGDFGNHHHHHGIHPNFLHPPHVQHQQNENPQQNPNHEHEHDEHQ